MSSTVLAMQTAPLLQLLSILKKTTSQPVVVVADDTDITAFVHHCKHDMTDVCFTQERWNKAWSTKDASLRNQCIKEHFLVLHSWSGCDTTSAMFSKGKSNLVGFLKKSEKMK